MSENQNQNPGGLPPQTSSAVDADVPPATGQFLQPSAFSLQPLKGESDRAFEAFRAYLELGPRRRFVAVGRKVGASLRTVQRWASDFDWRGRIKTYTASCADQSARTESAVHREEILDTAARSKAFRERHFALAEAVLDIAERYLERVEDDDLERLSLADACRALEFASRIAGRATETDAAAPDQGLRDQLASLLNQACAETPARAQSQ